MSYRDVIECTITWLDEDTSMKRTSFECFRHEFPETLLRSCCHLKENDGLHCILGIGVTVRAS
jgi:hypothetical protein